MNDGATEIAKNIIEANDLSRKNKASIKEIVDMIGNFNV